MVKLMLILHLAGVAATAVYMIVALSEIITRRGNVVISRWAAIGLGVCETITGVLLVLLTPGVSMPAFCMKGLTMIGALTVLQICVERRLQTHTL